jgi:hypothetical protein
VYLLFSIEKYSRKNVKKGYRDEGSPSKDTQEKWEEKLAVNIGMDGFITGTQGYTTGRSG